MRDDSLIKHSVRKSLEDDSHFQLVRSRNGSPGHFETDQNGTGIRTQFKPAPAISAKSFSVCSDENRVCKRERWVQTRRCCAHDESSVMMVEDFEQVSLAAAVQQVLTQCVLVDRGSERCRVQEGLKLRRSDERFESQPPISPIRGKRRQRACSGLPRDSARQGGSPSEIDTADRHSLVVPLLCEARYVALSFCS